MLHSKISQVFFSLLRAGLWRGEIDVLDLFPLSASEWQHVYRISRHHTVDAIVFDGVQKLPHNFQPTKEILISWLVRVEKVKQHSIWMNSRVVEQYDSFIHAGLSPILLKGQGLAQYYNNPLNRVCGDVDWYFEKRSDFKEAVRMAQDRGIEVLPVAGRSAFYTEVGCQIDLHQNTFDIHSPFARCILRKLVTTEVNNRQFLQLKETKIALLSPIEQCLQVNVHILKHLLSFGIGIRQLCDSAHLYHHYREALDGDKLQYIYKKIKIYRWVLNLHSVLLDYLGLPPDSLPFKIREYKASDWLIEDVLAAGNFGFHDRRYQPITNQGIRKEVRKRIWRNVQTYFPYAPLESIFFPITHLYTKLTK